MRNLFFNLLIAALIFTAGVSTIPAQRDKSTRQTEVKIYLVQETDEYDAKNPHGLVPVKRIVEAKSPLRNALLALTGKLTKPEKAKRLFSPMYGIKLLSVKIEKGTAYAYFTMPDGATFSGDGSPFIFQDAVEKTALQFSSVKKVVVCLDGILDFWSESDAPPKKCQ